MFGLLKSCQYFILIKPINIHTHTHSEKYAPLSAFAIVNSVLTFVMTFFKQHSHQNMEGCTL